MIYRTDLRQGTDSWRLWRHQGLGAADAPTLLGLNPAGGSYPDEQYLRVEKLAETPVERPRTFPMKEGQDAEPVIRHQYRARAADGWGWGPECVEHDAFGWLRASLDGLGEYGDVGLEIKLARGEYVEVAREGRVPSHHLPQLWHQLLVSGCTRVDYACLATADYRARRFGEVVIVPVLADGCREALSALLTVEEWWWACRQQGRWPDKWPAQIAGLVGRLRELAGAEVPRRRRKAVAS